MVGLNKMEGGRLAPSRSAPCAQGSERDSAPTMRISDLGVSPRLSFSASRYEGTPVPGHAFGKVARIKIGRAHV